MFDIVTLTPSAAVASGGTLTFAYPTNRLAGFYRAATGHQLFVAGHQALYNNPANFTIAFGANIVVTYNGATSIPAGTECRLQLNWPGDYTTVDNVPGASRASLMADIYVPFGAVSAAAATTVLATTAVANGNLVTLSAAVSFDVPRVPSMVSSNAGDTTQTVTLRGLDEYGAAMSETRTLNGTTSVSFQKAFKTIVSYQASAALAGTLSIGQTKILGLPVFIGDAGMMLREVQDGAIATAGTTVAGSAAVATAATGDVRGTWSPNGTPNGTVQFSALYVVDNPTARGVAQA